MKKPLHVAASPLTGKIFCGHILKDGRTWAANKEDVTIDALVAVAKHTLKFNKPIIISDADGTPVYKIEVTALQP
jgi:hypothetical protein